MKLKHIAKDTLVPTGKIYDVRVRCKTFIDGKNYLQLTIPNFVMDDGLIVTYHEHYDTLKDLAEHWEVPN